MHQFIVSTVKGLRAAKAMGNGRKLRGGGSMKMWDDMIARLDDVIEGK